MKHAVVDAQPMVVDQVDILKNCGAVECVCVSTCVFEVWDPNRNSIKFHKHSIFNMWCLSVPMYTLFSLKLLSAPMQAVDVHASASRKHEHPTDAENHPKHRRISEATPSGLSKPPGENGQSGFITPGDGNGLNRSSTVFIDGTRFCPVADMSNDELTKTMQDIAAHIAEAQSRIAFTPDLRRVLEIWDKYDNVLKYEYAERCQMAS